MIDDDDDDDDDDDKCIPKWGSLKESNLSRTLWWMLQLRGWPELFQHKHASPGCITPAHCDAWIKFQIRNDAMKGCGGKQCSRMFQVKTRQRLANFCLSKSFLDSAMLKHAEAIPRIFKQQYEQRRLLVACCPVLWKESWFLTSLRWVQFSAARYVQPFSSIKELTSQRNW